MKTAIKQGVFTNTKLFGGPSSLSTPAGKQFDGWLVILIGRVVLKMLFDSP